MGRDETRYQKRSRAPLVFAVTIVVLLLGACAGDSAAPSGDRLRVVTSLELFADLVRNVGGDRVEVTALLPSGADPHTYELAPNRAADIVRADVVFINGLGLEASIEDVITTNADQVVELSEGLPVLAGGDREDAQGNPHLWLDVTNAMRSVERIRDTLINADPRGAGTYRANAEVYLGELQALDTEVEAAVRGIPPANRKLVTFHDAFPYLAERYGLQVVAIVVPSPGQEPSARDVADLTRTLRDEDVPAVFKEPQFSARVLELAADDAGVRVLDLLSDAFADGVASYVELMRYNMRQLEEGLGGD